MHSNNDDSCVWSLKRIGYKSMNIILDTPEFVLGRNTLNAALPHISRLHAQITKEKNCKLFVKDLNSINGVYVNKQKIVPDQKHGLNIGDILGLGPPQIEIKFLVCHEPSSNCPHVPVPQDQEDIIVICGSSSEEEEEETSGHKRQSSRSPPSSRSSKKMKLQCNKDSRTHQESQSHSDKKVDIHLKPETNPGNNFQNGNYIKSIDIQKIKTTFAKLKNNKNSPHLSTSENSSTIPLHLNSVPDEMQRENEDTNPASLQISSNPSQPANSISSSQMFDHRLIEQSIKLFEETLKSLGQVNEVKKNAEGLSWFDNIGQEPCPPQEGNSEVFETTSVNKTQPKLSSKSQVELKKSCLMEESDEIEIVYEKKATPGTSKADALGAQKELKTDQEKPRTNPNYGPKDDEGVRSLQEGMLGEKKKEEGTKQDHLETAQAECSLPASSFGDDGDEENSVSNEGYCPRLANTHTFSVEDLQNGGHEKSSGTPSSEIPRIGPQPPCNIPALPKCSDEGSLMSREQHTADNSPVSRPNNDLDDDDELYQDVLKFVETGVKESMMAASEQITTSASPSLNKDSLGTCDMDISDVELSQSSNGNSTLQIQQTEAPKNNAMEPQSNCPKDPRIEKKIPKHSRDGFIPTMFPLSYTRLHEEEVLISNFLNWKVDWLHQLKSSRQSSPFPSSVNPELESVKNTYKGFDEYINTYYPLLMVETWENVLSAWRTRANDTTFKVVITHCETRDKLLNLKCRLNNVNHFSVDGHLIIMELQTNKQIFGYVSQESRGREEIQVEILKANLEDISKSFQLISCDALYFIKPFVNRCIALLNLYNSKMCTHIFRPEEGFSKINFDHPSFNFEAHGNFDKKQKVLIEAIAYSVVTQKPSDSKLFLIEGIPGTGKTNTLVGSLQQVLAFHNRLKDASATILVASTYNSAIDEIALRLISIREQVKIGEKKRKLRILRLGTFQQISPLVWAFSLQELIKKNAITKKKDMLERCQIEVNTLKARLNSLDHSLRAKKDRGASDKQLQEIQEKKKSLIAQMCHFQKEEEAINNENSEINLTIHRQTEADVIRKADIILTTFSDLSNGHLNKLDHWDSLFTTCFVDNATQVSEPELLVPLRYGVTTLVMFGDSGQLPILLASEMCKRHGLSISFFERMKNYYIDSKKRHCIYTLNDQYRMHPDNYRLLQTLFYNSPYIAPPAIHKKVHFPLMPLALFNFKNLHHSDGFRFIYHLCKDIVPLLKNTPSIGVVIPNRIQKASLLKEMAPLYQKYSKDQIKVDLIESFQGCESDILICLCLHRNITFDLFKEFFGNPKTVSGIISRSIHATYLCGNLNLLKDIFPWKELIRYSHQKGCYFDINSYHEGIQRIKQIKEHDTPL